ncbi:MAG: hypothetical protein C4339_05895 [Nitrososphaerota archaeon]
MRTELIWLEIAKKDLEAARCLFCKKLYPHSVFYLQQSIEKAAKSLVIRDKIITTEEDLKKRIGHAGWQVAFILKEKLIEDLKKYPMLIEKLRQVKGPININKLLREYQRYEKKLTKKAGEKKLWKISSSRKYLNDMLTEISRVTKINKLNKLLKNMSLQETLKTLKKELRNQIIRSCHIETEENKKKLNEQIEQIELFPLRTFCYLSLISLSFVFSPHAIRSRYPEDNFNPLNVYDEKMPLIQMLDSFIKITEESLENLEQYVARS